MINKINKISIRIKVMLNKKYKFMKQFNYGILKIVFCFLFAVIFQNTIYAQGTADTNSVEQYIKDQLLYEDNFDNDMKNWVVETPKSFYSKVGIKNGKLLIDVNQGATIWFKKKLYGNYLISFHRKVIVNNGHNDRLSDVNQFWMATDPRRENIFTRSGKFSEYDSLKLYYAGIGGNSNSTTRFRKYQGNGERTLLFDFQNKEYLLQSNKNYLIQIVVYNGTTKVFVDGKQYFTFKDDQPLKEGYFGFRTVQSRQEIDDFKVFKLK